MNLLSQPAILGELESEVMACFWDGGESSVKAIDRKVGKPRGVTLNTIQSTVKRLFEKGLLERRKVSHAYLYRPALTRTQFQAHVLTEVVGLIADGRTEGVLSAFVEMTESAGREQLELLEEMVSRRLGTYGDDDGEVT